MACDARLFRSRCRRLRCGEERRRVSSPASVRVEVRHMHLERASLLPRRSPRPALLLDSCAMSSCGDRRCRRVQSDRFVTSVDYDAVVDHARCVLPKRCAHAARIARHLVQTPSLTAVA